MAGDAEQPLDVGLAGDEQRGERGRHPLVAQRQAQVLGHRVDRRAADDAQPPEPGVGGMGLGEIGAHHDDHRMLAEPPRELIGVGHRPRLVAEPGPGALELPVRGGNRLGAGAGGGGPRSTAAGTTRPAACAAPDRARTPTAPRSGCRRWARTGPVRPPAAAPRRAPTRRGSNGRRAGCASRLRVPRPDSSPAVDE